MLSFMSNKLNVDKWWTRHFRYLDSLFDRILEIDGCVVECGLGRGNSFYKLAFLSYIDFYRDLWGFDSFQGFPEPSEKDESPRKPKKGEWAVNSPEAMMDLLENAVLNPSKSATKKHMDSFGLSREGSIPADFLESVRLVPGYFEDSLQEYDGGPIAFLHLDVDLYESYKQTLEFFWPLVASGGIIAFDEYDRPNVRKMFPGAILAINEFFGKDKKRIETVYFEKMHQHSRHFVVKW